MSIPGLDAWLASPQGRYVLAWESERIDASVADIFGFNALQLGWPACDGLRACRMPLRRHLDSSGPADLLCDFTALPVAGQSCDLVVLPHQLEFADEPHQILREVERILIPEGNLLITGFNPLSLWGVKNRLRRRREFPWCGDYLAIHRLRDWLKLLDFDLVSCQLGCYAPPAKTQKWLDRCRPLERAGPRWLGFAGGVYLLHAVKRVPGVRLITPRWQKLPLTAKALRPMARKEGQGFSQRQGPLPDPERAC